MTSTRRKFSAIVLSVLLALGLPLSARAGGLAEGIDLGTFVSLAVGQFVVDLAMSVAENFAAACWLAARIVATLANTVSTTDFWNGIRDAVLGVMRSTIPESLRGLMNSGFLAVVVLLVGVVMLIPMANSMRLVRLERAILWAILLVALFTSSTFGFDMIETIDQLRVWLAGLPLQYAPAVAGSTSPAYGFSRMIQYPLWGGGDDGAFQSELLITGGAAFSFAPSSRFVEMYFPRDNGKYRLSETATYTINNVPFMGEQTLETEASRQERISRIAQAFVRALLSLPAILLVGYYAVAHVMLAIASIGLIVFFLAVLPLGFFEFGEKLIASIVQQYFHVTAITLFLGLLSAIANAYIDSAVAGTLLSDFNLSGMIGFFPPLILISLAIWGIVKMGFEAMTGSFMLVGNVGNAVLGLSRGAARGFDVGTALRKAQDTGRAVISTAATAAAAVATGGAALALAPLAIASAAGTGAAGDGAKAGLAAATGKAAAYTGAGEGIGHAMGRAASAARLAESVGGGLADHRHDIERGVGKIMGADAGRAAGAFAGERGAAMARAARRTSDALKSPSARAFRAAAISGADTSIGGVINTGVHVHRAASGYRRPYECPQCGNRLVRGECAVCGWARTVPTDSNAASVSWRLGSDSPIPPAPAASSVHMVACRYCGAATPGGATHCVACGAPLNASPAGARKTAGGDGAWAAPLRRKRREQEEEESSATKATPRAAKEALPESPAARAQQPPQPSSPQAAPTVVARPRPPAPTRGQFAPAAAEPVIPVSTMAEFADGDNGQTTLPETPHKTKARRRDAAPAASAPAQPPRPVFDDDWRSWDNVTWDREITQYVARDPRWQNRVGGLTDDIAPGEEFEYGFGQMSDDDLNSPQAQLLIRAMRREFEGRGFEMDDPQAGAGGIRIARVRPKVKVDVAPEINVTVNAPPAQQTAPGHVTARRTPTEPSPAARQVNRKGGANR